MKKISDRKTAPHRRRTENAASAQQSETVERLILEPAESFQREFEREDTELAPVLDECDRGSLARARTHWFFGEWKILAELDIQALRPLPERDRFALLAASAHQQLGDQEKAKDFTRMALEWGCSPRAVAQVLVAGVHNTLGRASALKQDEPRITRHFEAAVAIAGNKDTTLVSHARSVREMARMGLLPQAASLVDKQLQETQTAHDRPEQQQARIRILETELSVLHQELSLAQQRQQLFRSASDDAEPLPDQNDQRWLEALKKKAVSQLGQDLWVLEKTNYKRGGFFVEFGATDGVALNNTWLLEKEFGWKGICAEPNPKLFKALKRNRNCFVSDACIGATTGEEVDFILADVFGGIAKYAASDMHAPTRQAYAAVKENVLKLRTVSLHDFLVQCDAPRKIDYMSIDTEGSELDILKAFPFDEWDIALLTIEHNFSPSREEIRAILSKNGYQCIEMEFDDWYYRQ